MNRYPCWTRLQIFSILPLLLIGCLSLPVYANSMFWDGGGGDNNLSTAFNWDLDLVPAASDALTIPTSSDNIYWDSVLNTNISSLTLSSSYTGELTVQNDTAITSNGSVTVQGGTLAVDHQLNLGSYTQGSTGTLKIVLDDVTNTEYGRIVTTGGIDVSGGTLIVEDGGLTFFDNDTFTILQSGTTSSIGFTTITLPDLSSYSPMLAWNTSQLNSNGVISVEEPMVITVDASIHLNVRFRFFNSVTNVAIDWGDNSQQQVVSGVGEVSHNYGTAGTYTVKIFGDFTGFGWESSAPSVAADVTPITGVTQWGSSGVTSLKGAFRDHINLVSVPSDFPSSVVVADQLFKGATSFDDPNVSSWTVSSLTDIGAMFYNASTFNQDIGSWVLDSVTSINSTFYGATMFNQDIGGWNVEAVQTMGGLFFNATAFNQDISSWKTYSLSDMTNTFRGAISFNQDVGLWDTDMVTTLAGTFFDATAFNQDVGGWNTASVTSMNSTFLNASAFDQDISFWNIENVTSLSGFLTSTNLSTYHYDELLIGFDSQNIVNNSLTLNVLGLKYTPGGLADTSRANLMTDHSWNITGDSSITTASTSWDSGGTDEKFSNRYNWVDDGGISTDWSVTFDTTSDSVVWDYPTTLYDVSLNAGFTGSVASAADTDVTVSNALTVSAGTYGTDAVTNTNHYTQGSSATLSIDLDSITAGEYGQINASGAVNLSGTLNVTETITESDGLSFDILNWSTLNNTFTTVNLPSLGGGLGWDRTQLYTSGVISIGNASITAVGTGLTEAGLNTGYVTLTLNNQQFVDGTLAVANFIPNNAPPGLTVSGFSSITDTSVDVLLSFDGTDFDGDITNFSITVDSSELTGTSNITSNDLNITALNDVESIALSSSAINEGSEDGAVITVTLSNGQFVPSLTAANWTLGNLPSGVSKGTVTWVNNTTAHVALSGNRTTDYDTDITNLSVTIATDEFQDSAGDAPLFVDSGVTFTATNDVEFITLSSSAINEGSEDGAVITVTLSNGHFVPSLTAANWTLGNLPSGVSKGTVTWVDSTTAHVALSGNRATDYDTDITNLSLTITTDEFQDSTGDAALFVDSGVTFTATNDVEFITLSSTTINEGSEDGAVITVTLSNGHFVPSLTAANWTLGNLPSGVVKGAVTWVDNTTAHVALSGNRTTDYDTDITSLSVTITTDEFHDSTGDTALFVDSGVTLTALSESVSGTPDSTLMESTLDAQFVTLDLTGDTFVDGTLAVGNFTLSDAPTGTTIESVSYTDADTAVVSLAFDGTDFDTDVSTFTITIAAAEITSGTSLTTAEMTITATNDAESILISNNVINEGAEDGELITVTLSGGQFVAALTEANWTLGNLPSGVVKGAVTRVDNTTAHVALSGNRTTDYDTDITNLSVTITTDEFHDSTGDTVLFVDSGVTLTALSESVSGTPDSTLMESTLDAQFVTLDLVGDTFVDGTLAVGNFTLSGAPTGTTIESVSYTDADTAIVSLAFDGTDFDTDVTTFTITIAAAETASGTSLTTAQMTITATNDAESISISDDTIDEGAEDGELITVTLTGGQFVAALTSTNWTVTNLPDGVTKGTVTRTSDTTATIALSGNSTSDYDSDITNVTVEVTASEFTDSTGDPSLSDSTGVTLVANNDIESITLSSTTINEGAEDGAVITVTLSNGQFVPSLTAANWTLGNLPSGVSKGTVTWVDNTTAHVALSGNSTTDYDADITNLSMTITTDEFLDSAGDTALFVDSGVTFTATNDAESISISDNTINEGAEDGELITVTLSGGQFVAALTSTNWTVTNLPDGVTKGTVTRTSDTTVTIALSGNSTSDYDSDITNVTVEVTASEFTDSTGDPSLSDSTGVTLVANNDAESITLSSTTINEGSEDGAIITVTLSNGQFVPSLTAANWTVGNLPSGVVKGAVTWVDNTTAHVALSGNRVTDYDTDITNLSMTITTDEFQDSTGDTALFVDSGVTLTALSESVSGTPDSALTESALDAQFVTLDLVGDTFVDATLAVGSFTLSDAPSGTTIESVTYTDTDTAVVNLAFDGTDFDTDVTTFTITVAAAEITSGTSLTTAEMTITATNDAESISISDNTINEGAEDGELITVTLSGGQFVAALTSTNWTVTNLPDGVTKGTVTRTSDTTATIALSGNSTSDYDSDITNVTVEVTASEFTDSTGDSSLSDNTGVTLVANNDIESISLSDDTIVEGSESGELITVTLSGGQFASTLTATNWTLANLPSGVVKGAVTRVSDTIAHITLSGNRNSDYDTDISDLTVTITTDEFRDSTGGSSLVAGTGVNFIAVNESVVVTPDTTMTEDNLDARYVTVDITGDTFFDAILEPVNFTLNNAPAGTTVETVTYIDSDTADIHLAFDGSDFDVDVTDFSVTIAAAENNSTSNITTGNLTITATDDAESISLRDDTINEGAEDGELITVTIANGEFADILTDANWILANLPEGVTRGAVTRLNDTAATVALSGNSSVDYDSDITNVSVTITTEEFVDSTGDGDLSSSSGITLIANSDAESLTLTDDIINEGAEDGELITVTIVNGEFADTLTDTNWILTNLPDGVTRGAVARIDDFTATVALSGNRTADYDTDITNVTLTIGTSEFVDSSGDTSLTAGSGVTLISAIETFTVTPDSPLTENDLDLRSVTIDLNGDTLSDSSLASSNFTLSGGPTGLSVESVDYIDSDTVTVNLAYDGPDFDTDISTFTITIAAIELSSGGDTTTPGMTITANNDTESITINDDGQILEGAESGEIITVTLSGGTFSSSLNSANWTLSNGPDGVTVGAVDRISDTVAHMTLSGNRTTDYDTDITDLQVLIGVTEFTDSTNDAALVASTGVIFEASYETTDFITTWDISVSGDSITLPLINGGNYDFQVDYGDGTGAYQVTAWNDADATHTYTASGIYTVSISGTLEGFSFNNGLVDTNFNGISKDKLTSVTQWGTMKLSYDGYTGGAFFYGASQLDITATDAPDLSNTTDLSYAFALTDVDTSGNLDSWDLSQVTNLYAMFWNADRFNQDLNSWTVDNVTNMGYMFERADLFDGAIGNWNVASVTNMEGMFFVAGDFNHNLSAWNVASVSNMSFMFERATLFNQDIGSWNVSSVTAMRSMFEQATAFDQNIGGWDVSSVSTMQGMFDRAHSFNQDISGWNVGNVTNMVYMFFDSPVFNQPIGSWNVSSVTSMIGMFESTDQFNQDLNSWNVSSLTTMESMFEMASAFNGDISGWDVSAVTSMLGVFYAAPVFNQDIGGWNVSAVTNMEHMFHNAVAFDQDLRSWDVHNVTAMSSMFTGVTLSRINYDGLLVHWDDLELQNGVTFSGGDSNYTAGGPAESARENIIATDFWSISDGGPIVPTATWDSGGTDDFVSTTLNWDSDETLDSLWALVINSTTDFITWDSPTTLSDLTLDSGFGGVLIADTNVDMSVTNALVVNDGELKTDALISAGDYSQSIDGWLTLALDDITSEYGRLVTTGDMALNGTLEITESISEAAGQSYTILSWGATQTGTFSDVITPALNGGLTWDLSALYTTGTISIVAQGGAGTADSALIESTLDARSMVIDLVNVTFVDTTLSAANFVLNNAPDGMTVESVVYNSSSQATVLFAFDGTDFDTDISNFNITVSGTELVTATDLTIPNHTITALNDTESITMSDDGNITEGVEAGELVTVTISGGTFASTLNSANWTVGNMPTGVDKGAVTRVNNTTATIALTGNSTVDYDVDDTDMFITITTAEFVDSIGASSLSATTGVTFSAVNEEVVATPDSPMTEANLNDRSITIDLNGDTFFDGVLDAANFTLNNAPVGTSIQSVIYSSSTQAVVNLDFDGTDFDVDIPNFNITIAGVELTGTVDITTGVNSITALNDLETITMTDDGLIQEGAENGEVITVTLDGGTFANTLNSANWSLANQPVGVGIGAVNRINATSAQVTLSGNSSSDYDNNVTNMQLTLTTEEYSDSTGDADLGATTGVTFTANSDVESIAIGDDGLITEKLESGEVITVTLTGGQFVASLNPANWSLTNLPLGVSLGSVTRVSDTLATVTLSGNSTTDYDIDGTGAQLTITTDEFTDSSGDTPLSATGITFTAMVETISSVPDVAMTEANLNDRSLTVTVSGDTFVDATLDVVNFTLNNAPTGLFIESIVPLSATQATVNLDYTGPDFDADITNLSVTLAGVELAGGNPLTSGTNTITANNDPESLTMSDDGNITEALESGELITVTLAGGTFSNTLNSANWTLTNLPAGVSLGSVIRIDNNTATLALSGNATVDYDTDITTVSLTVTTAEFDDSTSDPNLIVSTGITLTAVNEDVIATPDAPMTEANLNDRSVTIDLSGDTFSDATLDSGNFTLNNAPIGTSIESVIYSSSTQAVINIAFDGTDFDVDRPNFNITIAAAELSLGNPLTSGVNLITAVDDPESITMVDDGSISEGAESGEVITVTLTGGRFSDPLNGTTNWTVDNLPTGVTKGVVTRLSDTQATITLSGNTTLDYDSDITNVTVTITSEEFSDSNGMTQLSASSGVTLLATGESTDFISSWTTLTDNESIVLPLVNGGSYNFSVDYGDGTGAHVVDAWNDPDATHLYTSAGTYTVTISGVVEGFVFRNGVSDGTFNGVSMDHITNISQWGNLKLSYDGYLGGEFFHGASNLDITATDLPDLTNTTDLSLAFKGSGIDDSGNLNSWNVSQVTNMTGLFSGTQSFNQSLNNWNVSNVTSMQGLFLGARGFNGDISGWNVANVTTMRLMFNSADLFDGDVTSWNVSSVTDMSNMFMDNAVFNQDISQWNVSSVTNMAAMLQNAVSFDRSLGDWNVAGVTDMSGMLQGATLSTIHYDQLLLSWDALALSSSVNFHGGNSRYSDGSSAAAARLNIINVDTWTIEDGGPITPSANWDAEGDDALFSNSANWDINGGISFGWDVTLSMSGDIASWDSPQILGSVSLESGFTGTLLLPADIDKTLTGAMNLNAGHLFTDATLNTVDFNLGANGQLYLYLDSKLMSEYGRINASGDLLLSGQLDVINDGISLIAGDAFDLFDAASISGPLSALQLPTLPVGLAWDSSDLYTSGVIRIIDPGVEFDAGGVDNRFSTAANWGGDVAPQDQWGVVINLASAESLIWDSPAALVNLSLEGSFTGTVAAEADVDRVISQTLTVNSGTFSTDAVITVSDFNLGASGNLMLTLDSNVDGEYGRINTGSSATIAGALIVINDGLTFAAGDHFDLFNGAISGTFSSVTLPTLPTGLEWDQRDLYSSGVIRVQKPMMLSIDTQHGLTVDLRLHGSLNRVMIDWGDGSEVEAVTAEGVVSHTYSAVDTYTVSIGGSFSGFGWQENRPVLEHVAPITGVVQWNLFDGSETLSDLSAAFAYHSHLTAVPAALPSTVTDLSMLFFRASNFDTAIGSWNVANVTSMNMMFREASLFNQDISGWNTENVNDMYGMFREASSFNQPIGGWDVSLVTDMRWMFFDADAFNQDISGWNITSVTNMANMFLRAGLSLVNYDALLTGWGSQSVQSDVSFHGGEASYTAGGVAEVGRTTLITTHGWTIKDAGPGTEVMRWVEGGNSLSDIFVSAASPLTLSEVVIDSSETDITWDSPTTLYQLSLSNGFTGTLQPSADTDMSVTTGLWVNAGHLMTDALITSADYMQGVKGALTLVIDSKDDGQYGRIEAMDLVRFAGQLMVVSDEVIFEVGDQFDLFNGATFLGSFASITLPTLSEGLFWNLDALYTEGVISVDLLSRAAFAKGTNSANDIDGESADESAGESGTGASDTVDNSVWQLPSINRTVKGSTAPAPSATDVMGLDPSYLPVTHLNPLASYQPGEHTLYWRVRNHAGQERVAVIAYNVYPEIRLHHGSEVVLEGAVDELQISLSGQSPHYPITVELTVSGSATAGLDHSLSSNRYEMSSTDLIRVPLFIRDDQRVERTETVNVQVTATSSDGYRWTGESIEWLIQDANSAPKLSLNAYQDNHETFTVARDAGPMTLQVSMSGAASLSELDLNWNIPPSLMLISSEASHHRLLDPSDMEPGIYTVTVTASNSGDDVANATLNLRVTEGDAVHTEIVDSDSDYLPDSYDQSPEPNLMQLYWGASDRQFIEATEGLTLTLGVEAMALEATGAMINRNNARALFRSSIMVHTDGYADRYGAPVETDDQPFYSLEIHGLEFAGDSAAVAIPMQVSLQSDATLLMFVDGAWQEFRWNSQNQLYSIDSGGQLCPGVDETSYDEGVWAEADCLLIRVSDGGVNDRDRIQDGKVALFFTILPTSTEADNSFRDVNGADESSEEDEGGSFGGGVLLLLLGYHLMWWRRRS